MVKSFTKRHKPTLTAQGTVEYAVVFAALLSLIVALGVLAHFFTDGALIEHALWEASHHIEGSGGVLRDVFLY